MNNVPFYKTLIPEQLGAPANILPQQEQIVDSSGGQGSYWDLPIEQRLQALSTPEQYQRGMSPLDVRDFDLIGNFIKNAQQRGTSLAYIWNNLPEVAKDAGEYLLNTPSYNIIKDYANAALSPYNVQVDDFEKRSARDIIGGIAQGIYENPFDATLDAISLGALKPLSKIGDKVNGITGKRILPSSKGQTVENALATKSQEVRSKVNELNDSVKNIDPKKLETLVQAAEEGTDLPKGYLKDFKELKKFSNTYDELVKKYAPETYVNPKDISIIQKIARDNKLTYNEVRNRVQPYLNSLKYDELLEVQEAAKAGDKFAQQVLDASNMYDKGRIFPVTHALAEVNKQGIDIDASARIMKGRFSTREYGNATYKAIAEQLSNPSDYLDLIAKQYIDNIIGKDILTGKLGDVNILAKNPADALYVRREDLLNGDLPKALKRASKEKVSETDIPVDKGVVAELRHQTEEVGGVFSSVGREVYNLGKNSLLGQLTYLGGNAITGGTNALINSNAFVLNDILSSIATKGKLAKDMGIYRQNIIPKSNNKFFNSIQQLNNYGGGNLARRIDAYLQNSFAEIAANAELRRLGIPTNKRVEALSQLDKAKLGQVISDTRRMSLINSSNTILPKPIMNISQAANPFNRWLDTATQSSIRLLERNPLIANVALMDILGSIGYDKEMQNRLNLRVSLDRPYVSYRFDDKTGLIKEASAEFVPISTSIKLLAPDKANQFAPSIPFWTAMLNVTQGKDKYGNILKRNPANKEIIRTVGTKRLKYNADGTYEEVQGMGDEILATAIKELVAPVTLYNRTVAPLLAGVVGGLTNQDLHYNQPYGHSIFGSFNDYAGNSNILVGGNLDRRRTGEDVIKALTGRYETNYYPENRPLSAREIRSFWSQQQRDMNRRGGF